MDYESKRWKRQKASIIPIEETFTDKDINLNDPAVPEIGYRFNTPRRWANAECKNKSVGIRDLQLTPSSGDIRCRFMARNILTVNTGWYLWDLADQQYIKLIDDDTEAAFNPDAILGGEEDEYEGYHDEKLTIADDMTISREYMFQVTPSNPFEEVITNMLNFVNESNWKRIRLAKSNDNKYGVYSPKYTDSNNLFYVQEETTGSGTNQQIVYSWTDKVTNAHFRKLPIRLLYDYDADECKFTFKNVNTPNRIIVNAQHRPTDGLTDYEYDSFTKGDDGTHADSEDPPNLYRNVNAVLDQTALIENGEDENHDPIYITKVHVADNVPTVENSELLMIIEASDLASIESAYSLFNQPIPRGSDGKINISNLATVELVTKTRGTTTYVIPFTDSNFSSTFNFKTSPTSSVTVGNTAISGFRTNLNLNNVWDRIHLNYHASFAETNNRFIGRNGAHWDTPNKQFLVPFTDQDQFYLRFTTDGIHSVLPHGCHFNVDLAFMLNATNNTATGIHDHFRD